MVAQPSPPDPAALRQDRYGDGFPDDGFDSRGRPAGKDYQDYEDYEDYEDADEFEPEDFHEEPPAERRGSPSARSTGRAWLIMAIQLALSVVGGAAVWLGFNYLWGMLPQAALGAAVVVIVGLVLIVRKLRKAEDLQTTVLAVLVGLVVTVSPAVLLLLAR
jgi:hypothetical protein